MTMPPSPAARWVLLGLVGAVVNAPSPSGIAAGRPGGLGGFEQAAQVATDPTAAVRLVAQGIIDADNAGDIGGVLAHYADDAVLLPPGEEPVVGVAAIGPRYEAMFRAWAPAIHTELSDVRVEGNWAVVVGRNTGTMHPKTGALPARRLNDLFLMVLQRDARSGWRIARLMWHPGGAHGAD